MSSSVIQVKHILGLLILPFLSFSEHFASLCHFKIFSHLFFILLILSSSMSHLLSNLSTGLLISVALIFSSRILFDTFSSMSLFTPSCSLSKDIFWLVFYFSKYSIYWLFQYLKSLSLFLLSVVSAGSCLRIFPPYVPSYLWPWAVNYTWRA